MSFRVNCYYGPSPRYDGGAFYIHQAFRRIPGVECVWYQCRGNPLLHAKADLHVAVDWAEDLWPESASFIEPRPLVYWMSDTHCSEASKRFRFDKAKRADVVYCALWQDVPELKKEGVNATWLPYAAEPLVFNTWDAEPKADVGFVGHVGDYEGREDFLDQMFKAFPHFHFRYNVYHEECAWEMRKSKIALNHCWRKDAINMRVMEAMSAGCCLLTSATSDLPRLGIEDGTNCLTYRNTEEAIEKAKMILGDEPKRQAIIGRARSHILSQHTYVHRALQMLRDAAHTAWDVDVQAILTELPGKGREWGGREHRLPLALPI